jgi:hypothetical protein
MLKKIAIRFLPCSTETLHFTETLLEGIDGFCLRSALPDRTIEKPLNSLQALLWAKRYHSSAVRALKESIEARASEKLECL